MPYDDVDPMFNTSEGRTVLAILLQTLLFEIAVIRKESLNSTVSRINETTARALEKRFSIGWHPDDGGAEDVLIMTERQGDPDQMKAANEKAHPLLSQLRLRRR